MDEANHSARKLSPIHSMAHPAPAITVTTTAGISFTLRPVPMSRMPSQFASDWLKFQGAHVPGTTLSVEAQSAIQRFMTLHRSECLSDGRQNYTLAGEMLAYCDPRAIA